MIGKDIMEEDIIHVSAFKYLVDLFSTFSTIYMVFWKKNSLHLDLFSYGFIISEEV